jgi:hypothetical protein
MPGLRTAARYAFSIVVFALILYLFDANSVVATMAGANVASVVIAVGFVLGAQFIAAIRLEQLLVMQHITLPLRKVFCIGLATIFYGLIIPGGTVAAFAVRFAQLTRDARVEDVAAALVVDRVAATVFLLIIGVVAFAFEMAGTLLAGIIAAGMLSVAAVFLFGRRSFSWLTGKLNAFASDESIGRLRRIGVRVSRALLNYSTVSGNQVLMIFLTSVISHLFGCLAYFTIATGIGLDLSFLAACWVRSGMILSTMIPVSVAGLGLREITAVALLVPLGIAEAQAVGYSILIFLVTPVIAGLIGGLAELFGATGPR